MSALSAGPEFVASSCNWGRARPAIVTAEGEGMRRPERGLAAIADLAS